MIQNLMKSVLSGALLACALCPAAQAAPPQLRIRAWQFHDYNIPYLRQGIDLAPQYDVTHIVFSHQTVWYAEEMLNDHSRGQEIDTLAARVHRRGMKAWVWTHEIHGVPPDFMKNGKVMVDDARFWDWERAKYRSLFQRFKNLDGLILTFHETTYPVYDDQLVSSSLSGPARVTKLINTIFGVCQEFGKDLVVRTFAYEPAELDWIREGLLKTDRRVIIETKEVPHEWHPYYPHDPLIGAFPEHRQIIEYHSAAEIGGMNMTPYPSPEYFKMRLDYELAHGAHGYITRMDTGGFFHALGTPNELNLYTLYRLAKDPATSTETIWREWAARKYGEKAAPYAIAALKRAFDISNRIYYTLGFWVTDHTRFPSFAYASEHISSRTTAKWDPDPKYAKLENDLNHPYPELLEQILAEKDDAMALCRESLTDLEKGRREFAPADYDDLRWRFMLDLNAAIIWKYFNEAFFGYKALDRHYSPALKARVVRAVDALERWARINETEYGEDITPGEPHRMRSFVAEMRSRLAKVQPH